MQEQEKRPAAGAQPREDVVAGRNPVFELLKSGREVDSLWVQRGEKSGGILPKLCAMAHERGIPVKEVAREKLDHLAPGHQGVAAFLAAAAYATVDELLARAGDEAPFLILCDEIEDPHNLGAIIRSAEAAGAHGVVIPKRRGVGLTAAVHKASAGALSHLPVARVTNLAATIAQLKKQGIWVYAADMGGQPWCQADLKGPLALVVGSEGRGVSRLVKEKCDFVLSLPMQGQVGSLNASVAAGIVMYEVLRQRMGLAARGV